MLLKYITAGLLDTAYNYAYELIHSKDPTNKETGYQIILYPNMQHFYNSDSINKYLSEYLLLLESYYNENENQLALNQQTFHNYQVHERERKKAENSNSILKQWLVSLSFLILLLGMVILYLRNRDINNRLKLHYALENIETLKHSLNKDHEEANETQENKLKSETRNLIFQNESTHELREYLRKELYDIYNDNRNRLTIPPEILNSDTYKKLCSLISKGDELKENNKLWKDIEDLVLSCSPNFITNLQLLVGGKLTSYDLHTALLIKCGVQPTQMTILLNRSKGAIVSRRESLCYRVFDKKLGTKVIDGIIRLL